MTKIQHLKYLVILLIITFKFPIFSFWLITIHVTIQRLFRTVAPCIVYITEFFEISLFMCISMLVLEARLDEFFDWPSM